MNGGYCTDAAMPYCPACQNRMARQTTDEGVQFKCMIDGTITKGEPKDFRLGGGGGDGQSARIASLHQNILRYAATDQTTARIPLRCPKCSLPYLRRALVGEASATVFYLCDCGYKAPAADCGKLESTEAFLAKLAASAINSPDDATDSKGSED